jgi:hypothetical protein
MAQAFGLIKLAWPKKLKNSQDPRDLPPPAPHTSGRPSTQLLLFLLHSHPLTTPHPPVPRPTSPSGSQAYPRSRPPLHHSFPCPSSPAMSRQSQDLTGPQLLPAVPLTLLHRRPSPSSTDLPMALQKPRCPLSCPPQGLPPLESVGPASIQRIHTSWPCPIMSPHIPTEGHSTQKPLTMQIDENSFSDKEICMENRSNFPRATKSVRENLCTCGTSRFLGPQVPLLWWHHQATTRRPSILRPTETSARPGVGEKAAWRTSVTVITQPETRSLQRVQSLRITFQCIDTLKIACPSVCRA